MLDIDRYKEILQAALPGHKVEKLGTQEAPCLRVYALQGDNQQRVFSSSDLNEIHIFTIGAVTATRN